MFQLISQLGYPTTTSKSVLEHLSDVYTRSGQDTDFFVLAAGEEIGGVLAHLAPPHFKDGDFLCWCFSGETEANLHWKLLALTGGTLRLQLGIWAAKRDRSIALAAE